MATTGAHDGGSKGNGAQGPHWEVHNLPPFRFDPYWYFAKLTDYAYLELGDGVPNAIPLLLKITDRVTMAQFASGDVPGAWRRTLQVPALYAKKNLAAELAHIQYCSALASAPFFESIGDPQFADVIADWQLCLPCAPVADIDAELPLIVVEKLKPQAVVGVIDDALAFAHERFLIEAEATRVVGFWDQNDVVTTPSYPGYGHELKLTQINQRLAKMAAGELDEDSLYQQERNVRLAQRIGHGTHVLDIACGDRLGADWRKSPKDPSVQPPAIVAVQLPTWVTRDTSGGSLASYALDGLHYIIQVARRMSAPRVPIVVNMSYGMIAAPHDGGHMLEAAFDEVITLYNTVNAGTPLRVVLPSGNSHLARCHARFELPPGGSQTMEWRVLPDDWTPSFVEVWLPHSLTTPRRTQIVLTPPGGVASPAITQGQAAVWRIAGNVLAAVIYPAFAQCHDRHRILIAIVPTFTVHPTRDVAPAGTWQIDVANCDNGGNLVVDAWVQRADTPFGFPLRGRQSRFDDAQYEYRDGRGELVETDNAASYVKRDDSINAISTGRLPIVVGAARRKSETVAPYSAGGPTIPPPSVIAPVRLGPDVSAVSDDSRIHRGVLAAGTRSGSIASMFGTSVATPAVTRWIAIEMSNNNSKNTDRVSVAAIATKPPSWPAPARGGAGIVSVPSIVPFPRCDS